MRFDPLANGEKTNIRFPFVALCAVIVLGLLFIRGFEPAQLLFSNDNPFGALCSKWWNLPDAFFGAWYDINWLGLNTGAQATGSYNLFRMILGAVWFSKFYAALTLLFLGLCAWLFFSRLGLSPAAAFLGAMAAMLSSAFFSSACWGVGTQEICVGLCFLALSAVCGRAEEKFRILRLVLAGFAVGMGIIEALDLGAIFSLFVAAFVIFNAVWSSDLPTLKKVARGTLQVAVIAISAGVMASSVIYSLVSTQIVGTALEDQQKRTKTENWNWATQWSLPKAETLQIVVPGLFGYRMDTPDGGNYWGSVGRDPALDEYFARGATGTPPPGLMRFSGGGIYAGVSVVFIALWAVVQSFRKKKSLFTLVEQRFLWFWLGVALVSLLLSYGRFAPFYQFFYALPYFSTIRNPAKFTHVFSWALTILFACGVHGLFRAYINSAAVSARGAVVDQFKAWWPKAGLFERRWIIGCIVTLGVSLLAWLVYASSQNDLVRYLQSAGFDENMAPLIAGFSIRQVGWFVLFFVVSAGLLALAMAGVFSGSRARAGLVLIALVLVTDLARANMPWIVHWDYKQKYATNPVIDKLRQAPWEGRAVIFPNYLLRVFQMPPELSGAEEYVAQLYGIEWAQHHFPYYNIQSLDVIQLPRAPMDYVNYEGTLQPKSSADIRTLVARRWELTNTRYIIAAAPFVSILNQHMDPDKQRFRIVQLFEIVPKPGITRPQKLEELTAVSSTNGNFALIEFTGTLPRAGLYQNWQVQTNVQATLAQLADPSFDPHKTVLLSEPAPVAPPATAGTNQPAITNAGSVKITSYAPKKIVLQATAPAPSILLLNDRHDPDWKAFVDGKPEKIQRANYLMRAVFLSAGEHKIEFRFEPPVRILYVSAGAMLVGLLLCAFLLVKREG